MMAEKRWFRRYPKLTLAAVIITSAFLAVVVIESTFCLFLKVPVLNNYFPYLKSVILEVYFFHDRNIMQLMPECARYDNELTYTLRPGECVFQNIEYSNKYAINSSGLRDDEASLVKPEIVVLGDSYALGWGVDQEEAFARVIENKTHRKVLNAGVPSYGTAREVMLLNRIDTSGMKWLIIQYSANDFVENFAYVNDRFDLKILTVEQYQAECEGHLNRKRYTPLLFTRIFLNKLVKSFINKAGAATPAHTHNSFDNDIREHRTNLLNNSTIEVRMFLEILAKQHFRNDIQVIALNISHYSLEVHSFMEQLAIWKENEDYPEFIRQMKLIDVSTFLEKSDYFIIDDHLNTSGHRKVADQIIKVMEGNRY